MFVAPNKIPSKNKFKSPQDILGQMILVRAPMMLKFNDDDFDTFGTPLEIKNGVAQKSNLEKFDTFGMRLKEIINAAADGFTIYLLRKEDGQLLFDMLEEYLVRTVHNMEYNRSEEDVSFRHNVEEFANNMVTISNATMLKNIAAEKFSKHMPSASMVDDFLANTKKRKKHTVSY